MDYNINPLHRHDIIHSIEMAVLLRLAILGLCVAAVFAAVVKDDEPVTQTDAPADTTTVPPSPACTDGDRKPDTTNCHRYSECKEGAWKGDRCFWFRKFDSVTKRCVMWGATCAKD